MNSVIIYWSQTGNTLDIANKIANDLNINAFEVTKITVEEALKYDNIILGCPAMGGEELEEYEFRPFFDELKTKLSSQRLFLFGSYGWGGGEWMNNWEEEVTSCGLNLGSKGLISNGDSSLLDEDKYKEFIESIKR